MQTPKTRVIDGCLYSRGLTPYAYTHTIHELGQGNVEALTMPTYGWYEVEQLSPLAIADLAASVGKVWVDGEWQTYSPSALELLDKAALNIARSARRAATKVRRLCKLKGLNTMMTLTYAENVDDRERLVRDFDVFIKRVRRLIPDFQYVCVFERQARGSWHAHMATLKLLPVYWYKGKLWKSWDLFRHLWRAALGGGGSFNESSTAHGVIRSVAKLASYLSKYISKSFGGTERSGDSYRASGAALPLPVRIKSIGCQASDAARELCDLISVEIGSTKEFHVALLNCGGIFVVLSD